MAVCMYEYVCLYIRTYVCMYVRMYVRMHVYDSSTSKTSRVVQAQGTAKARTEEGFSKNGAKSREAKTRTQYSWLEGRNNCLQHMSPLRVWTPYPSVHVVAYRGHNPNREGLFKTVGVLPRDVAGAPPIHPTPKLGSPRISCRILVNVLHHGASWISYGQPGL